MTNMNCSGPRQACYQIMVNKGFNVKTNSTESLSAAVVAIAILYVSTLIISMIGQAKDVYLTFFGMVVGAIVTWKVAKHYYEKASHELTVEAKKLQTLNILMLRGLEDAKLADFSRDNDGNIVGMLFKLPTLTATSTAAAGIERKVIHSKAP